MLINYAGLMGMGYYAHGAWSRMRITKKGMIAEPIEGSEWCWLNTDEK